MIPWTVKFPGKRLFQPGILVVCGLIEEAFLDRTPELIVEVLSPATASKDKRGLQDGEYEFGVTNGHSFDYAFAFGHECDVAIDFNEIRS